MYCNGNGNMFYSGSDNYNNRNYQQYANSSGYGYSSYAGTPNGNFGNGFNRSANFPSTSSAVQYSNGYNPYPSSINNSCLGSTAGFSDNSTSYGYNKSYPYANNANNYPQSSSNSSFQGYVNSERSNSNSDTFLSNSCSTSQNNFQSNNMSAPSTSNLFARVLDNSETSTAASGNKTQNFSCGLIFGDLRSNASNPSTDRSSSNNCNPPKSTYNTSKEELVKYSIMVHMDS